MNKLEIQNHLLSESNHNNSKSIMPALFSRVTNIVRFTFSIKQDK